MGHLVHIASIIGVVACVHHFWPKGITYGEREEWEKAYRERRTRAQRSSRAQGWYDDSQESSRSSPSRRDRERERGSRRREKERYDYEGSARPVRERDIEYGTHPVYSRHASFRNHEYEYEDAPAYSRRASSRY
jgi:hypothetical protein